MFRRKDECESALGPRLIQSKTLWSLRCF